MLEEVFLYPKIKICTICSKKFIERKEAKSINKDKCEICSQTVISRFCLCFFP